MGDFDQRDSTTAYNYEGMSRVYTDLVAIIGTLQDAHDKVSTLEGVFAADYIGEASDEVNVFLGNLPIHILRLLKLYDKMKEFMSITSLSFQINDMKMVENMEN